MNNVVVLFRQLLVDAEGFIADAATTCPAQYPELDAYLCFGSTGFEHFEHIAECSDLDKNSQVAERLEETGVLETAIHSLSCVGFHERCRFGSSH